ncbi:MAG: hypothetical protein LW808_003175 [Verrucomicrobiota bacterium]|nr:MAG: hypothetical protein LW808_003175 [Verrucomicrobiota bacterium]
MDAREQLAHSAVQIQITLTAALLALGKKFLREIPHLSFADLGTAPVTLQKLIGCYANMQAIDPKLGFQSLSEEVLEHIQSQLNLM